MYSAVVIQEGLQRRWDPWRLGQPLEVYNKQLRGSLKLILLQLLKKLPKNSMLTILWSFDIWSKLERWKGSKSGHLMSWPQIKKLSFWNVVFSNSMRQQWTISWLDCDTGQNMDFMWPPAMTSSVVWLRSSKALPKVKCAWILVKSLHVRSILNKSMRCTENNTWSQYWSTERAQIFSAMIPRSMSHNKGFKCWMNGIQSFVSSAIFIWLLANWWILLQASWQLFAGKNASISSRMQKMLSKNLSNPEAQSFVLQE